MAVPVVLLGTFGVLAAFGYSINTLTMFGMVLAIGLLVDDAIVVVENVERVMAEEGLTPRQATRKSMEQITGALVGIAHGAGGGVHPDGLLRRLHGRDLPAVLASPSCRRWRCRCWSRSCFTPALCARVAQTRATRISTAPSTGFFGWFNRSFDRSSHGYANTAAAHAEPHAAADADLRV